MEVSSFQIFGLQFLLSLIVYAAIFRWYVSPWLASMPLRRALVLLLIPHLMRHLGMTFLVTTVVSGEAPRSFVSQVAYGDLLAMVLAWVSVLALRAQFEFARGIVWLFNVVGLLDLVNAFYQGIRLDVFRYQVGAAWYIPTFAVPLLFVTHYMIFVTLLKRTGAG